MDIREEVERLLSECKSRRDYAESKPSHELGKNEYYVNVGYLTALSEVINDLKGILGINV